MKTLFITTALALFAAPALAETKSQWGCEWKKADNGNYWTKVDGGCKHWIGLGYATQAAYLKSPAVEDDSEEPSDPGDGEGPGADPDDNGGGNEGAGPDDNGGGNEGPGTEGPSKPGKDRPGKGKGRR